MRGLSVMNRPALLLVIVIGLGVSAREAGAQPVAGSGYMSSYRTSDYFIAPGWYGTSYGFASYGMPQTYSVFSAYPGPSYGTNYPPYGLLPGRYGVGLWRPGLCRARIRLRGLVLPVVGVRLPDVPAHLRGAVRTRWLRPLRSALTRLRWVRRPFTAGEVFRTNHRLMSVPT